MQQVSIYTYTTISALTFGSVLSLVMMVFVYRFGGYYGNVSDNLFNVTCNGLMLAKKRLPGACFYVLLWVNRSTLLLGILNKVS